MRLVIQRVSEARVIVSGQLVAAIGPGLVVLVGIASGDTEKVVLELARRTADMRIFPDQDGRMNRSVSEVGGEVLVISQFTLCADASRGRRPSFIKAAEPGVAEPLVETFSMALEHRGIRVGRGRFGANMQVSLTNDGPVTIVLES